MLPFTNGRGRPKIHDRVQARTNRHSLISFWISRDLAFAVGLDGARYAHVKFAAGALTIRPAPEAVGTACLHAHGQRVINVRAPRSLRAIPEAPIDRPHEIISDTPGSSLRIALDLLPTKRTSIGDPG